MNMPNKATGKILFVDDEQNILSSLRRLFRSEGYEVFLATSGREGLAILEREAIDLVVSDMRMPEMDGAAFLKQVATRWPDVVRILLTGYADMTSTIAAINEGHIYRYLSKPWEDNDIKLSVRHAFERKFLERERARLAELTQRQNEELRELNVHLEDKVKARTAELEQTMDMLESAHESLKKSYTASIKVFASLIEMRDDNTSGHARRVADLARTISVQMGMGEIESRDVLYAGLLHDIGKIGLSDTLLAKPFEILTGQERQQVAAHPVIGQAVLMSLDVLSAAASFIRAHHERFDGTGYPDRLAGETIPLGARILAVANDYDAVQIGTVFSRRLTSTEAMDYIVQGRGSRYDPRVVDTFRSGIGNPEALLDRSRVRSVSSSELEAGMLLARDVITKDGLLLLAREHALDERLIDKLRLLEQHLQTRFEFFVYPKREHNTSL